MEINRRDYRTFRHKPK